MDSLKNKKIQEFLLLHLSISSLQKNEVILPNDCLSMLKIVIKNVYYEYNTNITLLSYKYNKTFIYKGL